MQRPYCGGKRTQSTQRKCIATFADPDSYRDFATFAVNGFHKQLILNPNGY
jgi:hypothetical protein